MKVYVIPHVPRFAVGQKVICNCTEGFLVQGMTYTIASSDGKFVTVEECLTIQGLNGYSEHYFDEITYDVSLTQDEIFLLVQSTPRVDSVGHSKLVDRVLEIQRKKDNNLI